MDHQKLTDDGKAESTRPWQVFEKTVGELLSLCGYNVSAEQLLGHKKVDHVASREEMGKPWIYAVECKDLASRVDKGFLLQIEADYRPLYEKRLIDAVLLVTRNGVTPAAEALIEESRLIRHRTLEQLKISLLDLRRYLRDISNRYYEEGLQAYYVPMKAAIQNGGSEPVDLDSEVMEWLEQTNSPPIALLGSYGSGKSTFMIHLAYECARRFEQGKSTRIPILLPLGEISSEQTIEGLLGRHFTYLHCTPGYNYEAFQALNRLGTFVLLLDGFDEMKHSMTPAVFRYTFKEVLKIVVPHSKTVLAGRPTAFMTSAEREEFLHASRTHGTQVFRVPGQPDFREISISPFADDQIVYFIEKYRNFLATQPTERRPQRIPERNEFFRSSVITELARRPVQLRMLFDVLPAYPDRLADLTVRELYTFFVDLLIRRESEKPARIRLTEDTRKRFMQNIAFCIWHKGTMDMGFEDIPDACFGVTDTSLDRLESVKRDLLSGAFVEVKYPNSVFFPHRSVQEYLVAEFLLSYFRGEAHAQEAAHSMHVTCDFRFLDDRVSPEVFDFMLAAAGDHEREGAYNLLRSHSDALSSKTLSLFLVGREPPAFLVKAAGNADPWALAIILAGRLERSWLSLPDDADHLYRKVEEWFRRTQEVGQKRFYQALFLIWLLVSSDHRRQLTEAMLQRLLVSVLEHTHSRSIVTKSKSMTVRLRPQFVTDLLQHVSDDRWFDLRDPSLLAKISFSSLYSKLSLECDRKIGAAAWFSVGKKLSSLPIVDTVACTDEIKRLLVERFDADAVPKGKSMNR